jgi:hypothetical protein
MADFNGTGGGDTYVGTTGDDTIHGNADVVIQVTLPDATPLGAADFIL